MFAKNLMFDANLKVLVEQGFVQFSAEQQGPVPTTKCRNAIDALLLTGTTDIRAGLIALATEEAAEVEKNKK